MKDCSDGFHFEPHVADKVFHDMLTEAKVALGTMQERVAIHGMDLYSMAESTAEVIRYLDGVDPALAEIARQRYACLTPYESDPSAYALAATSDRYRNCEGAVVAMLQDLLSRRLDAAAQGGDRYFDAVQNARVVANAARF